MEQSYYVNLREQVRARAKLDERNAGALLQLAVGIGDAFNDAISLTGVVEVGSINQAGKFCANDFVSAARSTMNVAVQVKFKDQNNIVILTSIVEFGVTMNGEDFDVVCLPTGKKVFVAFEDRSIMTALRPVVDLIDEPLSIAVAEFQNG